MRLVIVTTMQHPCTSELGWGAEKYIWDLVECLNKYGHEVILFAKDGSKCPDKGELIICSIESEVLDKHEKILYGVDIVHDFSATKLVHDYCQNHYIKSIATNFNTHFLYPTIHNNIVCVSDIQRYMGLSGKSGFENTPWKEMVGYTGHLKDAKRVYIGINLDSYEPKYEKEDYILFFNSWDCRKGITIALDLAKAMGFKLHIAGEVKGHPEHQETFRTLKPMIDEMSNVSYECDVSNERKIELMRNAKALLFPSLFNQPFAVVVIEALACGTPVIATNRGAMPEMIKHGRTGFLCNTIDELAKSINSLQTLNGADCRYDVIKRFDRMIMTKEYIKLYEAILKGEEW
jgi:glycosyltransferase involved in cell wall biosynthesis